ncbi:hypothetical protein BKK53_11975 [Rodentibacter trehalosifermentans]|nr:hypothetical protein BKK53_11975 [Rodentibacter trehalosifermentans]
MHPDEIQWIEDNAKRFAKEESERLGYQVTEQEAKARLITQAAQEVDFAWFKKIGNADSQAKSFLNRATEQGDVPPYDNRGTFINADGKRQTMFTALDKDEYYSTGKYSEALAKFDKANNNIITKTLQPEVQYNLYTKSLSDGKDAVVNGALYALNNTEKVVKTITFGIANCLKEDLCGSAVSSMVTDSIGAAWQSGKDIVAYQYNIDDVNYLYGKNMVNEIDAIAAVRGGSALLELVGAGRVVGKGVQIASQTAEKVGEKIVSSVPYTKVGEVIKPKLSADELSRQLPDGYKYLSLSEVEGPKGGIYHYIGDDGTGNPVFFNNNKFVSFNGEKLEIRSNIKNRILNNDIRQNSGTREFSIIDWEGYPKELIKPEGPFRLLGDNEYTAARKTANNVNNQLRKQWNIVGQDVDIHEITPVKFGGSPSDIDNKLVIPRELHRKDVTPWLNKLQKDIENQQTR